MKRLYGGIEAGGTKFVCAVGTGPGDIKEEIRFPSAAPEETVGRAIGFLRDAQASFGRLDAGGVSSFGPIDPSPSAPTWGMITTTPKPGWRNTNIVGMISREFDCPIGFDTDVSGAALGEGRWGAASGLHSFAYITVGTGIGGGAVVSGRPVHGLLHPEMGHVIPPRDPDDRFPGVCPFHGGCLEGLASGPAIEKRWGVSPRDLPPDHPAWALEARYLAWVSANLACTLSPQRIIFGGGVMEQLHLFPLIQTETRRILGGYLQSTSITERTDSYIVPTELKNRAGILGAFVLAERAYNRAG
ncbi:MAG: ROK family protein [Myxococcota bacterium]|jgi:fructokinase